MRLSAPQRLATSRDVERIEALMRASILELFPRYYDARQTAAAAEHLARIDRRLIEDGTYAVHEAGGELVACGGWSRWDRIPGGEVPGADPAGPLVPGVEPARIREMFVHPGWTRRGLGRALLESSQAAARANGFRSLVVRATLPGEPLYASFGFRADGRLPLTLRGGVTLECLVMRRAVAAPEDGPPTP